MDASKKKVLAISSWSPGPASGVVPDGSRGGSYIYVQLKVNPAPGHSRRQGRIRILGGSIAANRTIRDRWMYSRNHFAQLRETTTDLFCYDLRVSTLALDLTDLLRP